MKPSPLQQSLGAELERLLAAAGVEVARRDKKVRFDPEDEESEASLEHTVIYSFAVGGERFEVWAYQTAAGVMEPGDDWWPFDRQDFDDEATLVRAVLDHVRDILEEHEPDLPTSSG